MLTSFHWRFSQGAFNPPSPDATVESTPWYAGSRGPVCDTQCLSVMRKHRLSKEPFFPTRRRQSPIKSPVVDSPFKRRGVNKELSCPLFEAQRFTVVSQKNNICCILALLQWCCPATVIGIIIAIIVSSIKRRSWWLFPHVFVKIEKRSQPSLAYSDAATAVSMIKIVARFKAAAFHASPRLVLRSTPKSILRFTPIGANCRIVISHLDLLERCMVVRAEPGACTPLGSCSLVVT